ncbi:MAG: hypothetical protein ABIT37_18930 [Luteolibacter sp.]
MNSDPHESAAWRAFGMLDADEAASFDEAMRQDPGLRNAWREMNCLSAAVAAATVAPMTPRAVQLERLQTRLGLNTAKSTNWPAITGWAAAAVLTVILVLDRQPPAAGQSAEISKPVPSAAHEVKAAGQAPPQETLPDAVAGIAKESEKEVPTENGGSVATQENDIRTIARVETKRLIQEIEVLRDKLEGAQKRDQKRFEAVPGMSWPIVMTMGPPVLAQNDTQPFAVASEATPPFLTSVIGDALAGNSFIPNFDPTNRTSPASSTPLAIPVYDAARDVGTLVTNLPKTTPDEPYLLWVKTENNGNPVLVGQLPDSDTPGADSFDFSLGKTAVVPTGFILTKGHGGKPATPTLSNTILQGPR